MESDATEVVPAVRIAGVNVIGLAKARVVEPPSETGEPLLVI